MAYECMNQIQANAEQPLGGLTKMKMERNESISVGLHFSATHVLRKVRIKRE